MCNSIGVNSMRYCESKVGLSLIHGRCRRLLCLVIITVPDLNFSAVSSFFPATYKHIQLRAPSSHTEGTVYLKNTNGT